jgi:PIN domain nuclease of toxin-antitoxin system
VTYLLDTHVWLLMLAEPRRLGNIETIVRDGRNDLLLSAASAWGIAIKNELGRLPLPEPPASFVPSRIRQSGVTPLAIEHQHVLATAELPRIHRDPFDRLLVTQAQLLDVAILTADPTISRYGVETIHPS